MNDESCSTCVYHVGQDCRRKSPDTHVIFSEYCYFAEEDTYDCKWIAVGVFPAVKETDWCGEWKGKGINWAEINEKARKQFEEEVEALPRPRDPNAVADILKRLIEETYFERGEKDDSRP